MAEGIAVFYGCDLSGAEADRPTKAPAGLPYYATDTEQLFVSAGGGAWAAIGTPATGVAGISFTVGAEAGDVINVAMQLTTPDGGNLATVGTVELYLSDSATGDGVVAVAPDTGVAIGTDGAILTEFTADKHLRVSSESDGQIDVDIAHAAGAKTLYVVAILPDGTIAVSDAVTFAA